MAIFPFICITVALLVLSVAAYPSRPWATIAGVLSVLAILSHLSGWPR